MPVSLSRAEPDAVHAHAWYYWQRRGRWFISNPAICTSWANCPAPSVLNRSRRRWIPQGAPAGERYRAAAAGQRRHRQRNPDAHRSLATDASCASTCSTASSPASSCARRLSPPATTSTHGSATPATAYLQERVLDVRDVCFQLLQHICMAKLVSRPGPAAGKAAILPYRRADPQPVSGTG